MCACHQRVQASNRRDPSCHQMVMEEGIDERGDVLQRPPFGSTR